jgi:hypothetical protein
MTTAGGGTDSEPTSFAHAQHGKIQAKANDPEQEISFAPD